METTATFFFTFAATPHQFKSGITSYWLHHFPFEIGYRKVDVVVMATRVAMN